MKRVLAVAAALSFLGCAHVPSQTNDAGVLASYSVFPPTTVQVTEPPSYAAADQPGGMIDITTVNEPGLAPVLEKFEERAKAGDPEVWFRINSPGGSVFAGLDFIQKVEDLKREHGTTVVCVVDSKAYSMAFVFLQTFCDDRRMTQRATLLAHNASGSVEGTAEQMRDMADFLAALSESLAAECAERLEMPLEDYKAKMAGKDWTMSSKDAVAFKAVDSIVVSTKRLPKPYKLSAPKIDIRKLFGL